MLTKQVFFNRAQQYFIALSPRIAYIIASRRLGKTEGFIMPSLLRNIQHMPRGQHAFIANSYKQALTRTLPAVIHSLKRLNYHEGIHFFTGRKAPDKMNFATPYIEPKDWSYYQHWYNGSVVPIISQDVPFSSNSLTLSTITADEARTLNYNKLVDETFPAITPMSYFQDCPWEGAQTFVTDMPPINSWILKQEANMDSEVIEVLNGLIIELYELNQKSSDTFYYQKKIQSLQKEINFYRKQSFLFATFDILDNLELVGEQYIKDRYRDMPIGKFLTQIMSYKLKFIEGGFYQALSEKLYYSAIDITYLESFRKADGTIDYDRASKTKFDCTQDVDIVLSEPLYIAFDTNISVNNLVVGQPDYRKQTLRTINAMHVKGGKMLQELCEDFCEYYKPLPHRNVIFYYDHTFLQGRSGTNVKRFYETILDVLRLKGWNVYDVYIGQAMAHDMKHKEIDSGLKAQRNLKPLFNKHNCDNLIKAMEKTVTTIDKNGWQKDKREEKLPDSEDNPVEQRTHVTDAFDTLYIGCNFYRVDYIASSGISTSIKTN